jgi:hypothetical protein
MGFVDFIPAILLFSFMAWQIVDWIMNQIDKDM